METAVALPTLTPLQISFGWGGKKIDAGWVGLGLSVCICVCGKEGGLMGVDGEGIKQDKITDGTDGEPIFIFSIAWVTAWGSEWESKILVYLSLASSCTFVVLRATPSVRVSVTLCLNHIPNMQKYQCFYASTQLVLTYKTVIIRPTVVVLFGVVVRSNYCFTLRTLVNPLPCLPPVLAASIHSQSDVTWMHHICQCLCSELEKYISPYVHISVTNKWQEAVV